MANEAKWIKIVTDLFDDEKMLLIDSRDDADEIIVIWLKLLCLTTLHIRLKCYRLFSEGMKILFLLLLKFSHNTE